MLNLFSDSPVGSSASVIDDFRPQAKVYSQIPVPVFKFDDLDAELVNPDIGIIKIDVEGAELQVLESMAASIVRDKPAIIFEILPSYTSDNPRMNIQEAVEKFLFEKNFVLYRILKSETRQLLGIQKISAFGIHSDLSQCDYVALHSSIEAQLSDLISAN